MQIFECVEIMYPFSAPKTAFSSIFENLESAKKFPLFSPKMPISSIFQLKKMRRMAQEKSKLQKKKIQI